MKCPDCHGKKDHLALIDYADGGSAINPVACDACRGTGEVDDEWPQRQKWAAKVRHARVKRRLHLGDAVDATGVNLVRYSAIERGIAIPTEGECECIEAFVGVNR
jgi:hypothetical protein